MTTANTQMVTRCPQCATAFRITSAQLQSAKGAVRCGSCLHVFKALDHVVGELHAQSSKSQPSTTPDGNKSAAKPQPKISTNAATAQPHTKATPKVETTPRAVAAAKPITKPVEAVKAAAVSKPAIPQKPTPQATPDDDRLISDDMDNDTKDDAGYEFDGYLDIDLTPKATSTLFDREIREPKEEEIKETTDESWAEELMDDDDDIPTFSAMKVKQADETHEHDLEAAAEAFHQQERHTQQPTSNPAPGLVFSLIGEAEPKSDPKTEAQHPQDDFVLSDELANAPNYNGFSGNKTEEKKDVLDPNLFETPDETAAAKRHVKTEPKIRAYDNSRTALLMNIIPAPVEFTAKRMRRWYQKKLWPTLSTLALITLIIQIGWFKFDYFSRVEPYRTGYVFMCPFLGCQVPTLVDTRQVSVFNLVVRAHPDAENALLVDAIILNKAPFEQPFTDLVLAFTDLDEKPVASRRFTPKEYLGGELAGKEFMPRNQPIHLTLELVDPGTQAVNYHAYIPHTK